MILRSALAFKKAKSSRCSRCRRVELPPKGCVLLSPGHHLATSIWKRCFSRPITRKLHLWRAKSKIMFSDNDEMDQGNISRKLEDKVNFEQRSSPAFTCRKETCLKVYQLKKLLSLKNRGSSYCFNRFSRRYFEAKFRFLLHISKI